jgi:predicted dehydrogenase
MPAPVIALVGCGAIAEQFYLPAFEKRPDLVSSLILVDRDGARAEALRSRLGAASATDDHRSVLDSVQGAIIATPHQFHTPLTLEFVDHGVHVLSEKPLSRTPVEVDQVVQAAAEKGVHVAVNHTRRLFTSFQEVQRLIRGGAIGELREVDYVLGEPFGWPAETNTYFGTSVGGRGVLYDTGAHIVDLVCWFMGGEPELLDYEDDSRGGTEAVAKLKVRLGPAIGTIHLSWLTKLRNTYRVVGTNGSLEGRVYEWSSFTRRDKNGRAKSVRTDKAREFTHFADKLLANFAAVVEERESPIVPATEVRPAISLIDNCYAQRKLMDAPWYNTYERLANV